MDRMPSLFISHGSPELAVRDSSAHRFLANYASELPTPRAILVVSAHWETEQPVVATGKSPATVFDFGGFDPRLRLINYNAPGAPEVALQAQAALQSAGFRVTADDNHGWDHGVWVPLHLLYPDRKIPVAQVSIQPDASPQHHLRMGLALAPLRDEGVMIITSGAMTHNLRAFRGQAITAPVPHWVSEFRDWMKLTLTSDHPERAVNYREEAPYAVENHPEAEHILPLFVAIGATHRGEQIQRVHDSVEHGVLAMDIYRFG